MISQEEMLSVIGSKRYIGGLANSANGHLHPLNLGIGEARAAEQNDARFFEKSPVLKIHHGANSALAVGMLYFRLKDILKPCRR